MASKAGIITGAGTRSGQVFKQELTRRVQTFHFGQLALIIVISSPT
jgi:hypothetical protein